MNGFGDFGTKRFSLFGSRNMGGPWTALYTGELSQGSEMTKKVEIIKKTHLFMSECLGYPLL